MAKGIEDTAFLPLPPLVALNEVGADPDHVAVSPEELFGFVERTATRWPTTMTTLSTHDTKRSEDVRARLLALSERPLEWQSWLREAQELARPLRGGRWTAPPSTCSGRPSSARGRSPRTGCSLTRARRSARTRPTPRGPTRTRSTRRRSTASSPASSPTSGSWPTSGRGRADRTARPPPRRSARSCSSWCCRACPTSTRATSRWTSASSTPTTPHRRLRRPPRPAGPPRRRRRPGRPADEKLLVTSRALRLRRDQPRVVRRESAAWQPVVTGSDHLVAVGRGTVDALEVVAVVTRLAGSLPRSTPGTASRCTCRPVGGRTSSPGGG